MTDNLDERYFHQDYQRKSIRIPPPKPVREALSQLLSKRGYAQIQTASNCDAAWRAAVGSKIAGDTRPGNVKRGVLEVLVRNPSMASELAFQKSKIIKTLTKLLPDHQIRDVRFRVGTID